MKTVFLLFIAVFMVLMIAGCSNDFEFSDTPVGVSLTYNDHTYIGVQNEDCEYEFSGKNMVFLFSEARGEFNGMSESYNVYRHKDDEDVTFLFVIPKPSIRDVTPYAFVLKAEN